MTSPRGGLPDDDVAAYLARIVIEDDPEPCFDWLQRLHTNHLHHVPFENLDLHTGTPIDLALGGLVDKLVHRRRGGFCYELNGLFAALLRTVGFHVTLVSCRVHMPDGVLSPPFDHLALVVDERWLADVGFGDAFRTPHELGATWDEDGRAWRTRTTEGGWLLERDDGDGWRPVYVVDATPRDLAEFTPRCRWHETSPDSNFQRAPFVSLATPDGRITISPEHHVTTIHGAVDTADLTATERHAFLRDRLSPAIADAFEAATRPSNP